MRTRKVQVVRPVIYPACCVSCFAVENSGRLFFVDLGFDISHLFDAQPEGVVYLCNICMVDYLKTFMEIIEERERTLGDISFGGPRTNSVFDGYRATIDSIQHGTESNSNDVEPLSESNLTANFGG